MATAAELAEASARADAAEAELAELKAQLESDGTPDDAEAKTFAKALVEAVREVVRADSGGSDMGKPGRRSAGKYVVTTDALTMRVGPKPNHVQRFTGGTIVEPDLRYVSRETIDRMVRLKGLAPHVEGQGKQRTNARLLAAAASGDDPARVPLTAFLPTTLTPDVQTVEIPKDEQGEPIADPTLDPEPGLLPPGVEPNGIPSAAKIAVPA